MLSYIEKFFYKYVPNIIKVIFAPTLTILVAFPIMFIVVAPLGGILGDGLSIVFSFRNDVRAVADAHALGCVLLDSGHVRYALFAGIYLRPNVLGTGL